MNCNPSRPSGGSTLSGATSRTSVDVIRLTERTAEEESRTGTATHAHLVLAVAVTLLSLGITLAGMAIIAKRCFLWLIGLVLGMAGAVGVVPGIRDMSGL